MEGDCMINDFSRRRRTAAAIACVLCSAALVSWGDITTNVWQTSSGGSINDAANWGGEGTIGDKWTNSGFLDFRNLASGETVSAASAILFSGLWFGPSESGGESSGTGAWTITASEPLFVSQSPFYLRVDDGELTSAIKLNSTGNYELIKQGNGTLVLNNSIAGNQSGVRNLYIEDGEVRVADVNALRNITYDVVNNNGLLTIADNVTDIR